MQNSVPFPVKSMAWCCVWIYNYIYICSLSALHLQIVPLSTEMSTELLFLSCCACSVVYRDQEEEGSGRGVGTVEDESGETVSVDNRRRSKRKVRYVYMCMCMSVCRIGLCIFSEQ